MQQTTQPTTQPTEVCTIQSEIISAQEVANWLGLDVETIYKQASRLGGVKFARKWLFDRKIVYLRLFGDAAGENNDGIEKNEKWKISRVSCSSAKAGRIQEQSRSNARRSESLGSRMDQRNKGESRESNPYNLGVGNHVSWLQQSQARKTDI